MTRLRTPIVLSLVGYSLLAIGASGASPDLVWHVETTGGETVESRRADVPINPASLVKVATSLWALETLGAEHRFETWFGSRGAINASSGLLDGDLVVVGGADPDFHVENAFLVARRLNDAGIERVAGQLVVTGDFWIGWEGGSEGRDTDGSRRRERMARRLRDALDPDRWDRATRTEWQRFAERRSIGPSPPARVEIVGGAVAEDSSGSVRPLLVHRSNPLPLMLKRFNAYSNNDIERLGRTLGGPDALADHLASRWGGADPPPRFETLSGLGVNRMSPRQIVRLMRDFREFADAAGLRVEDVLPTAGCDPGTMEHFPSLNEGDRERTITGKTGTLTRTDDGVATLAGYLHAADGERVFCVAMPRAAGRIREARRAEEAWVTARLDRYGGPRPHACGLPPDFSDTDARLVGPPVERTERYLPGHSATTAGSIPFPP